LTGFEPMHHKGNCLVGSRVKTTPPQRLLKDITIHIK